MNNSQIKVNQLNGLWKSILVGGAAGGLASLVPIVNLLNLFFMMWPAVGGAITVFLLCRHNDELKPADALITGSLSGALAGLIFGVFVFAAVSNISMEKIEKVISLGQAFFPGIREEMESILQEDRLKALSMIVITFMMLLSVIVGALGGIVSRSLFNKKENDE